MVRLFGLGKPWNSHVAFLVDVSVFRKEAPGALIVKILIESLDPGKSLLKLKQAHRIGQAGGNGHGADLSVDLK